MNIIYGIFVIIVLNTVTGSTKLRYCPVGDGTIESYNPTKSQCCFGIEDKQEGKRCCVSEKRFYFTQDQICCDKLYDKVEDGKEYFCCGDKRLVSGEDDGLCCEGEKSVYYSDVTGEEKENHDCCGSKAYDTQNEQCCMVDDGNFILNSTVQPYKPDLVCCGLDVIDITQWQCGKNYVPLRYEQRQCYVDEQWKVYNRSEQRCCYGKYQDTLHNVSESDPSFRCCGNKLMDAKLKKCCGGRHEIPNKEQYECCGEGYFDKTREKCCSGKPVRITHEWKTYCCGSKLIDYIARGCCGGKPYNRLTEQCCGTTILSKGHKCCGDVKQEKGDKCCLKSFLIKDAPDDHNDCCYDYYTETAKTYNNKTQECRNGKINRKRSNPLLKPCGDGVYNMKKDLCCNQRKYVNGINNGLQCCGAGTNAYNSDEQMCCFSGVFNIPENSGMCCRGIGYAIGDEASPCKPIMCGGTLIDPEQFICCNDQKSPVIAGDSCCGSIPYDKREFTCCGNSSLFDGPNKACCGTKAFNDNGKMCCGDLEIISLGSEKRKCCGNLLPYSPSENFCDDMRHVSLFYKKNPPPKTVCPFDEEEMHGVRDQWPMFYCSHKMVVFGKVNKIVQSGKRGKRTIIFLTGVRGASNDRMNYWHTRLRIIIPDVCKDNLHLIDTHLMISTDRLPTRPSRPTLSFRSAHKFFVTTSDRDLKNKVKSFKKCKQLLG